LPQTYLWQVPIDIVVGNDYKIRVGIWSSAGNIKDESDMVFSIVDKEEFITITSPNGGERWVFGAPQTITWEAKGVDKVSIYLWFPDGGTCLLAKNISATDESYNLTIQENQQCSNIQSQITAGQYKISIWSTEPAIDISAIHDYSDDYFSIVSEDCHTSNLWSWNYCSSDCKCDAGQGDCDLNTDCNTGYCTQNVGSKYGQVSSMDVCEEKPTLTCTDSDGGKDYYTKGTVRLGATSYTDYCVDSSRIVEYSCPTVKEQTIPLGQILIVTNIYTCSNGCQNGACVKEEGSITIISPNGGEKLTRGTAHNLRWISDTTSARVVIDMLNEDGKAVADGLPAVIANNEALIWNIPDSIPVGRYKMKIAICPVDFSDRDCANLDLSSYGYDISNDYFNIVGIPFISSVSPTSGISNDMITIYGKNLLDTIPSGIMIEFLKNGLQKATQSSSIFVQPDGLSLKFQLSGLIVENSELGTYQIRILNDHGKSNIVDFTILSEDCHTSNLWSWNYCSSGCKCDDGQGDCDRDADCNTGYCAQNVGSEYGQVSSMDVCEEKPTLTCTDSDGGKDYYQKGTVIENEKTYTDYCQGAFYLKEYFCLPYSSTGLGGAGEEDVICPNSGSCIDGACVDPIRKTVIVTSPNGGEKWEIGKNYQISWRSSGITKVDIQLNCDNTAHSIGSAINSGSIGGSYSWTVTNLCLASNNCKIMVSESILDHERVYDLSNDYFSVVSSQNTCIDSDGGKNYYLKGTATGKSSWDGSLVNKTDSCYNCNNLAVTSNSCNAGSDCCVSDWYCNADGKVSAASLSCPYGCENGACKSGGVGIKNMEDQLADASQTISELIEKLKSFLKNR
jgi:hypothetical protein